MILYSASHHIVLCHTTVLYSMVRNSIKMKGELPVLIAMGYPVLIQVPRVGWSFKSVRFSVKEFEVGQTSIKGGLSAIHCNASAVCSVSEVKEFFIGAVWL
jgi:hypothetical protein